LHGHAVWPDLSAIAFNYKFQCSPERRGNKLIAPEAEQPGDLLEFFGLHRSNQSSAVSIRSIRCVCTVAGTLRRINSMVSPSSTFKPFNDLTRRHHFLCNSRSNRAQYTSERPELTSQGEKSKKAKNNKKEIKYEKTKHYVHNNSAGAWLLCDGLGALRVGHAHARTAYHHCYV